MKVTKKELIGWSTDNCTIRYRGDLYKVRHQGLTADGRPNGWKIKTKNYFLMPVGVGSSISFYHKGRGIYGLKSNRVTANKNGQA